MARIYKSEDLLRLRQSPLVCKPASLLPKEEWMGPPVQDQSQKRLPNRGKPEEPFLQDSIINRRAFNEVRNVSRGSGTVPEDIVLGPPKTSFSSAAGARNGHKVLDPTHRPGFGSIDEDAAASERPQFRDRFGKDGNKIERDGDRYRDSRSGNSHSRRNVKDDSDHWSSARPPKVFNHDDAERGNRKNEDQDQEREREGGREPRVPRGFENNRRDGDREGNGEISTRRNGPGRGRYEPSWYREEDRHDGAFLEGDKDTAKPRDWRDKDRVEARAGDRDWGKTNKPEQDPEWMDGPDLEEKKQAHTQEDFERWKERMKANNAPAQDLPLSPSEQKPSHERTISNVSTHTSKSKVETPLVVDSNFDSFFGLWSDNDKEDSKLGIDEKATNRIAKNNAPKPSKFTGFFSTKSAADSEPSEPSKTLTSNTLNDSSNEDREGFQRILKLLDQQQPQNIRNGSSARESPLRSAPNTPSIQPPRSRESNGLESLLASQLPKGGAAPQNKDSEFLLKLMQQTQQTRPNLNQANSTEQRSGGGSAPGLLPFSNLMGSSRDINQPIPAVISQSGVFNEPAREDLQPRDKLNPNANSERKGLPPGFLESSTPGATQRNVNSGVLHHSGMPSGLQRPPGLEQISSVFGQSNQPLRQGMVPPPGFQGPVRSHNQFPPGLMPNIQNSNNSNERGPLSYGLRPIPPSGMPPPGFMGINILPLGFPPSPFNQEDRMSPSGRLYFGAGPQRQGSDGFGEAANFGMGGQGILPGQYRRHE